MYKPSTLFRLAVAFMPSFLVELIYRERKSYRGATIDAQAMALGELSDTVRTPGVFPEISDSRAQMLEATRLLDQPGPRLARVEDVLVRGAETEIRARIYSPSTDTAKLRPAVMYLHGGGFVQGSLDSHDAVCRKLAKWSGAIVVAVDYRLAPQAPYPCGVDDAIAAFLDISDRAAQFGIDRERLGVGGDSAGGCFAAVVSNELSAKVPYPVKFQVLIYPVTEGYLNTDSINDLATGYVLSKNRMTWYRDLYRHDFDDFDEPKFSPLYFNNFASLPPSLVLTAGFDPLSDDGINYVRALEAAGIKVSHLHYAGQVHGFVSLTRVISQGTQALRQIADWIKSTA